MRSLTAFCIIWRRTRLRIKRDSLMRLIVELWVVGHLRDANIHGQLAKHYWWPQTRADIISWCRGCLTKATRHVGQAVRPLLTPIPVEEPFHMDILQLPVSAHGNKYVIVFMDYLPCYCHGTPQSTPERNQNPCGFNLTAD